MRLRILIVSHFFPPLNSIASHRPYSWARTWTDLGHCVTVLTTAKRPFDGASDLELDLSGIEVHTVSYLPVSRSARDDGANKRSVNRWEHLKRMTRRLRFGLGLFADLRMLALPALLLKGRELLSRGRYDLIISTYQPEVAHLAAASLSRSSGVPWVADYRDLWHLDISGNAWRATSCASAAIERRAVSRAAMISTISEGLARELSRHFARPVFVCYNGYLPLPSGSEPRKEHPEDRLRLVHTGLLYRGKRDPEPLLRALSGLRRRSPEIAARIRLEFYGVIDPWFIERVKAHHLEDLVHLGGRVPFTESIRAQRGASALLFFDWAGGEVEGVVSGKLFEYLGSGRPILVIGGRPASEAADIVERCRAGWRLDDDASLARWLENARPERLRSWRPDTGAVADFSRARQAVRLLEEASRQLAVTR